jgi:hypothetical protein
LKWLTLRDIAARLPKAVHEFRKDRCFSSHVRRAAAYGVRCDLTAADLQAWYAAQDKRCYWCGATSSKDWHIDHFIPMSTGGPHHPDNLVISCARCNLRKHDSDPLAFAARLGLPPDFDRYQRIVSIIGGDEALHHFRLPLLFSLQSGSYVLEGCTDFELANTVLLPIYQRQLGDCECHFVVSGRRGDVGAKWRVLISCDGYLQDDDPRFRLVCLRQASPRGGRVTLCSSGDAANAVSGMVRDDRLLSEQGRAQLPELEKVFAKDIARSVRRAEKLGKSLRLSDDEKVLLERHGYLVSGHHQLFEHRFLAFFATAISGGDV